jgi:dTDP-4-dehydrorhamnose reductase
VSRFLITGAGGFLGATVLFEGRAAGREVIASYHEKPVRGEGVRAKPADLSRPGAAYELLVSLRPAWVINCAGLANVDACEKNPALARELNVDLPRALAAACKEWNARLLHVSTDSVFDGERGGYTEADTPAPVNVYAQTKLEGESEVLEQLPDALVVRTNFVGFSAEGKTGLADWIIRDLSQGKRIPGFADVIFSPLVANDLARVLFEMMDHNLSGLFHVAGSSPVSKLEFAHMLARELELDEKLIQPARLADAHFEARRPKNTALNSGRVEAALGRRMASIEESIALLGEIRQSGYSQQVAALIG